MYRGGTRCRSHTVAIAPVVAVAVVAVTRVGVTTGGRGAAGGGGLGALRGSNEGPEEPLRKRPEIWAESAKKAADWAANEPLQY